MIVVELEGNYSWFKGNWLIKWNLLKVWENVDVVNWYLIGLEDGWVLIKWCVMLFVYRVKWKVIWENYIVGLNLK